MLVYIMFYKLACCGPAFFDVRPHSMGETRFFVFVVLLENHLKNGLKSPLIFVLF